MTAKEIRDQLVRAKIMYTQKKNLECVGAIIMALRNMGDAVPSPEVGGALREVVTLIGKEPMVTDITGEPIVYVQGQEKALLVPFAHVFKTVMANKDKESHAEAKVRKLKIDKAFNDAKKFLQQNNVSEADQCFSEAIKFYKDEHTLFALIGEALMEANAPKRAFPYLKKGVEVDSKSQKVRDLYEKCEVLRKQPR